MLLSQLTLIAGLFAGTAQAVPSTNPEFGTSYELPSSLPQIPLVPDEEIMGVNFLKSACPRVLLNARYPEMGHLSPLAKAIVAACANDLEISNELFEQAEARDPNSEVILLIHGRTLWTLDRNRSLDIWKKLKAMAKNPEIVKIADLYLSGPGEPEIEERHHHQGHPWNAFGTLFVGGRYETNPDFQANSAALISSPAVDTRLRALAEKRFGSFTVEAGNVLSYQNYLSAHTADLLEEHLELAVSYPVSNRGWVGIRPFGNYNFLGGNSYSALGGAGVYLEWTEAGRPIQLLQVSLYYDEFFDPSMLAQQGSHIKIELGGTQPDSWFNQYTFYVERVAAGWDTTSNNVISVPYNHNDFALMLSWIFPLRSDLIIGVYPRVIARFDTDASSSSIGNTGSVTSTQTRTDWLIGVKPMVTFRVNRAVSVMGWLDYTSISSNLTKNDYQDRNITNETVGLGVQYRLGND